MQGLKDLSLFSTKKKPAPAGDEEGWMRPADRVVVVVFLQGLPLRGGEGVQTALRRTGARQEVNGTVVRPVGRQRRCFGLAEDLAVSPWAR